MIFNKKRGGKGSRRRHNSALVAVVLEASSEELAQNQGDASSLHSGGFEASRGRELKSRGT